MSKDLPLVHKGLGIEWPGPRPKALWYIFHPENRKKELRSSYQINLGGKRARKLGEMGMKMDEENGKMRDEVGDCERKKAPSSSSAQNIA